MGPRMYRVEQSLVRNAERLVPKVPLCPSCAQNMRLIRRTQRFGTLPNVCTFECRGCGVSHFEEYEPPKRCLIPNDKENAAPTNHNQMATVEAPLVNVEATNRCDAL